MSKVKVQLVKYDMSKTKNRNRKDMLVDGQTERDVINQLERIHKGERVEKIHAIVWGENLIKKEEIENPTYYGTVKFFDKEKGFGFIEPENEMDDLFFHATACEEGLPHDKDRVEFKVIEGKKGLAALHIKVIYPE